MPKKDNTDICPKCGTQMEAKGEVEDSTSTQSYFLQCPKCKNIELKKTALNQWFRFEYP